MSQPLRVTRPRRDRARRHLTDAPNVPRRARPCEIDAEGTTELLYRAIDSGGNVSDVGVLVVSIDGTAPDLAVTGVADGDVLGSSQSITVDRDAADATSGIAEVAATLDGEPVAAGAVVDLALLELGEHTVTVVASDMAGNTTEVVVTFDVETSLTDLSNLLDRYIGDGSVSQRGAGQLRAHLDRAQQHADAGRDAQAATALDHFINAVDEQRNVEPGAAEVLLRNAEALLASSAS